LEVAVTQDRIRGFRRNVMVDLSVVADGYSGFSGIPHDTRLIFSMLCDDAQIAVGGLVYPLRHPASWGPRLGWEPSLAHFAAGLHMASRGRSGSPARNPLRHFASVGSELIQKGMGAVGAGCSVHKLPDFLRTDALWRMLFQRSLGPKDRQRILEQKFYLADVTEDQVYARASFLPFLKPHRLDLPNCHAVLFPTPRPFRVDRSTVKIVRYHDAIPIRHPDTTTDLRAALRHHRFTKICARDSVFVCNSPMSRDDLDNVAPGAADRAVVIPCAVQPPVRLCQQSSIRDILSRRMSLLALGMESLSPETIKVQWAIEENLRRIERFRYIISVSTIEPRKNFVGLIAAWERMRAAARANIKLVLVGSYGWAMEETLRAMRPHVLSGDLIHVHKLPRTELQALYEQAELCAFVSFAEGFGYCPLEALQMGTPVVVSDIPVFRWSLGDAAHFADPYNVAAIADAMRGLLDEPNNQARRARVKTMAQAVVDRFSIATISKQWSHFIREGASDLSEKPSEQRTVFHIPPPQPLREVARSPAG
jgi:glycosyltransferase involved in cell wall biosynthesis